MTKGQIDALSAVIAYSRLNLSIEGLAHVQGYAWEITTKEGGWGLDGVLNSRKSVINGIVNGVDVKEWDPSTDKFIAATYSKTDLSGELLKAHTQLCWSFAPHSSSLIIKYLAFHSMATLPFPHVLAIIWLCESKNIETKTKAWSCVSVLFTECFFVVCKLILSSSCLLCQDLPCRMALWGVAISLDVSDWNIKQPWHNLRCSILLGRISLQIMCRQIEMQAGTAERARIDSWQQHTPLGIRRAARLSEGPWSCIGCNWRYCSAELSGWSGFAPKSQLLTVSCTARLFSASETT